MAPWFIKAPIHFLPTGEAHLGSVIWAFSAQYWSAFTYAKGLLGLCEGWKSWLPNYISWRGMNQSLSSKWWAGSMEGHCRLLPHGFMSWAPQRMPAPFHVSSCRLSWPRTLLSSHHHTGSSICCACHLIHSVLCIGEGSGSSRWKAVFHSHAGQQHLFSP